MICWRFSLHAITHHSICSLISDAEPMWTRHVTGLNTCKNFVNTRFWNMEYSLKGLCGCVTVFFDCHRYCIDVDLGNNCWFASCARSQSHCFTSFWVIFMSLFQLVLLNIHHHMPISLNHKFLPAFLTNEHKIESPHVACLECPATKTARFCLIRLAHHPSSLPYFL